MNLDNKIKELKNEKKEKLIEINILSDKLKKKDEKIKYLNETNIKLNQRINELEYNYKNNTYEYNNRYNDDIIKEKEEVGINGLNSNNNNLNEKIKDLEDINLNLMSQIIEKEKNLKKLMDENYKIISQRDSIKDELKNEKKILKSEISSKNTQIYELQYDNNNLTQKINKLEALATRRYDNKTEIKLNKNIYKNKEINDNGGDLTENGFNELFDEKKEMNEIKEKCDKLEKENHELITSRNIISQNIYELENEVKKLKEENEELIKQKRKLYSEKNEYNKQIDKIYKYKENRILELEKMNNELKEELRKKEKEENNNNKLYRSINEKDHKIKILENYKLKYDMLEKENNELIKEKHNLKESLLNLEKENKHLNQIIKDINNRSEKKITKLKKY